MSAPDADARAVVAHFQNMLRGDGSVVELQAIEGETLKVRFSQGDCDACMLAPEDLAGMMEELLARRGSALKRVELAG